MRLGLLDSSTWIRISLSLALTAGPVGLAESTETASEAPTTPTFTTPQMPEAPKPTQPEDRKNGSGSAQAAAIAGAAMASAMCAMLMRQAMNEKDSEKRLMLMMMANQQCMQAAQSAQAAKENGNSKEKLSQSDSSKAPQLPASQALKAPEKPKESDLLKDLQKNTPDNSGLDPGIDIASNSKLPDTKLPGSPNKSGPPQPQSFAVESISSLSPIPNANLTVQEDAKNGAATQNGFLPATAISASAAKSLGPDDIKALIESRSESGSANRKRASGLDGAGGDVSATSSSSGTTGESKDFDSMMASLMGGGQLPGEPGGAAQDVLAFEGNASRENIFHYASFRYQRAAKSEQRIAKTRPRTLASQVIR